MSKKAQGIWSSLWEVYKIEWKRAWCEYKTIIGPFIKGTASYLWLLIAGLLTLVTTGLYESGKALVAKLIALIDKA